MKNLTHYSLLFLLSISFFFSGTAQDTIVVRNGDLGSGLTFWSNSNVYVLEGEVVKEQGRLLIGEGTRILARDVNSGLTIKPAATIGAVGSREAPVVFTAESVDNFFLGFSPALWRGITIEADENTSFNVLNYVSIAYAGAPVDGATGAALFLDHVSDRSVMNFIEVMASEGDGIRIHGGEVDIAHAAVTFAQDDAFDWDFGWTGSGLYWFAYNIGINPLEGNTTDRSYYIEGKGNLGRNERTSKPEIFNATLVSSICAGTSDYIKNEAVINLKDNTGGLIANSLIVDFPGHGIKVEDLPSGPDARRQVENGHLQIVNNVWWRGGPGALDASENGIIKVDSLAEDPQALFLEEHLKKESNVFAGVGIRVNRNNDSGCYAFDPRPNEISEYQNYPNAPYPLDDFFRDQVDNENQKGAFSNDSLWINHWSQLSEQTVLGDMARESLVILQGNEVVNRYFAGDTITIQCDSLINFHNKAGVVFPCDILIILLGSASRRGNKRRPKNGFPFEDEWPVAFIEEWEYEARDFGCHLVKPMTFTLQVIDTIPPTIHPIPDGEGGLTAFSQDCDESSIIAVQRDTTFLDNGLRVTYTFTAEDFSGNRSTLSVEKIINIEEVTVYADLDGDGYGNPALEMICSIIPKGFVLNGWDCNDDDPAINPETTFERFPDCTTSNDVCFYATEIALDSDCVYFSMGIATPTIYPKTSANCGVNKGFSDIWAWFQAPPSGNVLMDFDLFNDEIGKGNSYMLELFSGTCDSLVLEACIEGYFGFEASFIDLSPGENYYFRIFELTNNPHSEFTICLSEENQYLPNNVCENAMVVERSPADSCVSVFFDNTVATNSGVINLSDCSVVPVNDLWFTYEALSFDTVVISFSAQGSGISYPLLNVYSGVCDNLVPLACDFIAELFAEKKAVVTLAGLSPGEIIWIQAAEYFTYKGEYLLEVCRKPAATATSTSSLDLEADVRLFPNPTTGSIQFQMELPESTVGTAVLFDLNGRRVRTFFEKKPLSRRYATEFQLGALENGVYFFQLQTAEGTIRKKILLLD